MARRRSAIDADLHAIYAQVPTVECKGLCADSCGPIDASGRERQLLRQQGVRLPDREKVLLEIATGAKGYRCPALSDDNRCTVYVQRPLICRLWGAVESMPCTYGCQPSTAPLPDVDAQVLLSESLRVGGDSPMRSADGPPPSAQQIRALMSDPAVQDAVWHISRHGLPRSRP